MIWEMLIGGIVVCAFLSRDRVVGAVGAAQGQACPVAQKCLRQLRAEQPQPGRGDDGCAEAGRLLQRSLSRDLRPDAFGYPERHDRAGTAGAAAPARCARRQRRAISTQLPTARTVSSPSCPTGDRLWSRCFALPNGGSVATHEDCSEQRQLSRQLGVDQAVPGIGARQCTGMRGRQEHRGRSLHLRQPRVRTVLALFPRQHRRQARRRDFPPRDRRPASRRRTRPRSTRPMASIRNEFVVERGSETARSRLQPRGRARRQEPAGIPDRDVRRRHRPPVAVRGTREHQEIPRTGGRQHSGVADRRARQRRAIPARQPQRRDHPQPPARGRHRPDGCGHLQSAGSQADHRARRGRDQEARPAHRRTSDLHQGRAAAVPDAPHDGARRCRRAAISDQDP